MVESIDYDLDSSEWCEYHQCYEKDEIDDYRVCGECWHIFRSPKEVRVTFYNATVEPELRRWWDKFSPLFWARNIFYCPLCGHDF